MVQKAENRCDGVQALLPSMRRDGQNGNPGCQGWAYEVSSQEVRDAYRFASQTAEQLGLGDRLQEELLEILAHDRTPAEFVRESLGPYLEKGNDKLAPQSALK